MMEAVSADPKDRSAFESQGTADRKEILKPLWTLEAAMGKEAVVAESDAEAACDPVEK
jgi:hypothetical protein